MCRINGVRLNLLAERIARNDLSGIRTEVSYSFVDKKELPAWPESGIQVPSLNAEVYCASNEDLRKILPTDESVDGIISSLSLHIVTSPELMLGECHRVLKKGKKAIFTVWGRKEGDIPFNLFNLAKESVLGKNQDTIQIRTPFHLNDRSETIKMMEKSGFVDVTTWESFAPLNKQAIQHYRKQLLSEAEAKIQGAEQKEAVKKYITEQFDTWDQTHRTPGMNVLFFLATKGEQTNQ